MGTRGFITFVVDGTEKTAYNHWDSYPDGLGADVLEWLRKQADLDALAGQVRALRVVDPKSSPTAEDIARFSQFSWNKDQHGGDRDLRQGQEWYDLLHEVQGKPDLMLEAGVIEDAGHFPADSLFAEWGYVIDLDAQVFEVYKGFQDSPHDKDRFASRPQTQHSVGSYYPVALVQSWPLAELPDSAAFDAAFAESEDEL